MSETAGNVGGADHDPEVSGLEPATELETVGGAPCAGAAIFAGRGAEGIAATSAPLGGAVGGDEGTAGTPGKEYISEAGGNTGAEAHGPPFSPSRKLEDDPGAAGGNGAATGGAVANEAAIARKSASVKVPKVGD
jgi:hypothetical protein